MKYHKKRYGVLGGSVPADPKAIEWEFIIKPCPWCRTTPKIHADDCEHSGGTWLWYIQCQFQECLIKPKTREIGIRNTCKLDFDRQKEKLNELVSDWNSNNPIPAYEKTLAWPLSMRKNLG